MSYNNPAVTYENYEKIIFNTNITTWFVDESYVYRYAVGQAMKPINGAIVIFNPLTGQLILKTIHANVWNGNNGVEEKAMRVTAKELGIFIGSLPVDERPHAIIVINRRMLKPINFLFLEFIDIMACHLEFPCEVWLNIMKVADLIHNSTIKPQILSFNLYDDWRNNVSSHTAFSRLMLITRALHVNKDKSNMLLLSPTEDKTSVTNPDHFWPSLTEEEWVKVDVALRDIILEDYYAANGHLGQNPPLTQSQINDLILGAAITPPVQPKRRRQDPMPRFPGCEHIWYFRLFKWFWIVATFLENIFSPS